MPFRRRWWVAAALGVAALAATTAPQVSAGGTDDARVIGGVSLVNDATGRPVLGLSPVTDGTVVDRTRLAGRDLDLRADLAPGAHPDGVTFTLTGAAGGSVSQSDPRAPYQLRLPETPDTYTLTVRAQAAGAPVTVRFTVTGNQPTKTPVDVLFVGNSLLGTMNAAGEDTPRLVRHLAEAAGRTIDVTEVIHSGYTLRQTWNDGLLATPLGGGRRYDFIVLQEYSTLLATDPAAATDTLLNTYAPTFGRALKPGGRVVLVKNWALVDPKPFPSRAAATAAIDAHAAALSAALSTPNLLAPIGDAFETVIAAKGTSYLIAPDGKHPNDAAIYLDAAILYGILCRESPAGLADLYLSPPAAAYLRSVAAAAIGY
ncbi:hypothetical protein ACFO1B_15490 [Dactylosporangium siamense]|uniref:SGNH hydrolase-type esterase domain-containing protein n=1 Tax=Dactylosporangium siamense TaxID=685454 RepID=A0A919PI49_9ACTN|nr:hypothetical protein [Dactylosporangium siamense]GIG45241.1 hypothetical protein Dsi01nite_032820 [Dactylosporangium siamense]